MGLRFRKSIKICKGVRVNFSKSGISYTLGVKGASVSVGKKGAYLNAGIPGTGIYSRERIGGSSTRTSSPQKPTSAPVKKPLPSEVVVVMNDKGLVVLQYGDGRDITDQSLIRRIKATPQFKAEKERLELQRQAKINEILEQEEKDSSEFLNLHKQAPRVSSALVFNDQLAKLSLQRYVRKSFAIAVPSETEIRHSLEEEATKQVSSAAFWKVKNLRLKYVEDNLPRRLADARMSWEQAKASFEISENMEEERQNSEFTLEYEQAKDSLQKAIAGESGFISSLIDSWIGDCTLPVEININYDYKPDSGVLLIDLDLPEIEDVPDTEYVRLDSGNLKEKKKPQAKMRQEYATLVFGLSVFVAANLFNLTPAVKHIVLSGYTQRRDTAGNLNDDYIISIKFNREPFETKDVRFVDPIEFCMQFENRCKMTSTMMFKAIEPYLD